MTRVHLLNYYFGISDKHPHIRRSRTTIVFCFSTNTTTFLLCLAFLCSSGTCTGRTV
ncbi:hypothetical protein GQ43DRAFT_303498 [Delitschia confertaspora ATCC 74209]|uniref:Uncharacterized protein n=1 Tax=Delitschia confertaspora ATCC 74209 TaxID=1513339 RepID=A0A9P4JNH6_9PLEO|nr:hypothetical protein GQ43DRAFT_303498 [Delitschia confertaspora ATCC 74209]